ncbi:transposase [Rhodococcus opacus]|nr:transposase [Rhodococcus opacus]
MERHPRFSGHFRTRFYVETEEGHHGNEEVSAGAAGACGAVVSESDPKPVLRRLAEQLNVHPEALRNWIRQAEADHGSATTGRRRR